MSNAGLTAYNADQIPLFGSLHGPITLQPGSPGAEPHQVNSCWYVADTSGPAILWLPSCDRLKVIKMNCAVKVIQDTSQLPGPLQHHQHQRKQLQSSLQMTSSKVSQIGSMAKISSLVSTPSGYVMMPPQKCPISICPRVKAELDKMVKLDVIIPVYEPMDHHCTPTVAHEFAHSKYFTIWIPYHQYCFLHLPFYLACSQDVFQKRMDQILEECKGCIGIADDITTNGCT